MQRTLPRTATLCYFIIKPKAFDFSLISYKALQYVFTELLFFGEPSEYVQDTASFQPAPLCASLLPTLPQCFDPSDKIY